MVTALVITFLITGLSCVWMALISLSRLDWKVTEGLAEESEEERPRATRPRRPIQEVR